METKHTPQNELTHNAGCVSITARESTVPDIPSFPPVPPKCFPNGDPRTEEQKKQARNTLMYPRPSPVKLPRIEAWVQANTLLCIQADKDPSVRIEMPDAYSAMKALKLLSTSADVLVR